MSKIIKEITRIRIVGFYHDIVDYAIQKIIKSIDDLKQTKLLDIKVKGPIPLPTDREIITILRATHKYKDSREQFEKKTHKRIIDVINATSEVIDTLMHINLPKSVKVTIEKV